MDAPAPLEPDRALASLVRLAARAEAGTLRPAPRGWAGESLEGYRRAAVMLLFTPSGAGVDVFLVRRAEHLRHHPGEISLPGGRIEDGEDAPAAALRELAEETGVDPAGVAVLGRLWPQTVPVSQNVVTPVLGWSRAVDGVAAVEPGEVLHTVRVPVAELLSPRARATVRLLDHTSPGFATPAGWVWGFTGLLLDHVFTELGWAGPWDRAREVRMVYDPHRRRVVTA